MKWQEGAKSLNRIITSSQSTRSRRALGFGDYLNPNEAYDPNESSVLDPDPPLEFQNPVKFVKQGEMHSVSPNITGTFMPTSECLDHIESQLNTGKKTPPSPTSSSVSDNSTNEFMSYSFSDKTSETSKFASCDSSVHSDSPKTSPKSSCKSADCSRVAAEGVSSKQTSHEDLVFNVKNNLFQSLQNNSVSGVCLNNSVCDKTSFVMNKSSKKKKCFVCGSKFHLIKDCDYYDKRQGDQMKPKPKVFTSNNRNKNAYSNRPVPADGPSERRFYNRRNQYNNRPFFWQNNNYNHNGYWSGFIDPRFMGGAYWDPAVKSSADWSWNYNRPFQFRNSKDNGGSYSSARHLSTDPQGRLKSFMT